MEEWWKNNKRIMEEWWKNDRGMLEDKMRCDRMVTDKFIYDIMVE